MKTLRICIVILASILGSATTQAKTLTNDPLTGLPLIPATVLVKNAGNEPVKMPDGQVCKSKMQGDFYSLYNYSSQNNIKFTDVVAWYSSHLTSFKKLQNSESKSPQVAFYNSDGTIVVFITAKSGGKGETHGVAYERYQPGLSERTITSLTQRKFACQ